MTGVGGWVKATVCGGAILAAGGAWLVPERVLAQQREGATAPVAVQGDAVHGRYLVEQVAMCGECHSTRDQAGDIVPGTRLNGGPMPVQVPWPADWPLQVPRIAGLPGYSDVEALRLLTRRRHQAQWLSGPRADAALPHDARRTPPTSSRSCARSSLGDGMGKGRLEASATAGGRDVARARSPYRARAQQS